MSAFEKGNRGAYNEARMIHGLSGKLKETGINHVVVDVNGVYYKVFISLNQKIPKEGEQIQLYTYLHAPEGSLNLYGFFGKEELELFEALISVSGVGPKSAMAVLSVAPAEKVVSAIASGDPQILKMSSGIGKKTAERIIVELKDKVGGKEGSGVAHLAQSDQDVFEALTSLGYPRKKAEEVVRELDPKIEDVRDRLREALKKIKD